MASVDFSDFQSATTIPTSAYFVGYEANESGGERKWELSTLANAVSSIISPITTTNAAIKFNDFSSPATAEANDFLVGYDTPVVGGERRYTLSTLAVALSSLMEEAILNKAMTTIGNYPYLEVGWVTAPNASYQTIASSAVFQTINLKNTIQSSGTSFGSLNASLNQLTLPAGTYRYDWRNAFWWNSGSSNGTQNFAIYDTTNSSFLQSFNRSGMDGLADMASPFEGQFTLASSSIIELRVLHEATGTSATALIGDWDTGSGLPSNSNSGASHRVSLKLWKVG